MPGPYDAGSGGGSWNYTDPHNDLTHQWMMEANAFNAEQAQITRDWQEKMSNTAYQRAMADMAKAGLNPILAGSLGGASTPGGATATANFTGAGATSSGGSSYWQRSIADNVWNMGMDALNSAGREALGNDLAGIIRNIGAYIGRKMGEFEDSATTFWNKNSGSGSYKPSMNDFIASMSPFGFSGPTQAHIAADRFQDNKGVYLAYRNVMEHFPHNGFKGKRAGSTRKRSRR